MAVTMSDVAREAGVSAKTVSNVINDFPLVKDATRARVQAAIDRLGYRVNPAARALRSGRGRTISLVIPELNQPYLAELAQLVIEEARSRGLSVIVETTAGDHARELGFLTGTAEHGSDGVILSPNSITRADLAAVRSGERVVLIGEQEFDGDVVSHVGMANVAAAQAATRHLVERGCRRIAAIGAHPVRLAAAELRLAGYRAALAQARLPYDPALVAETPGWHREDGAAATARLLDRVDDVDGVFAFNDALGLGALRELTQRGLRVPEDVALIGFDDTQDSRFSVPSLSTIDPGRGEIARTAVALVADMLAGRSVAPREITVSHRLVVRESSGGR